MIQGVFVENIPFVQVVLGWGQSVSAPFVILDTGFTGDLQVTPQMAAELGLRVIGVTRARIASGEVVTVPVALALASMERVINYVEILISNGMPLLGINFLTKFNYQAVVDCKYRSVRLERMA